MGNLLPFKIKIKNENNEIDEISINSFDKIKKIKSIICKIHKKYFLEYLLIYKDNQLLDDNNTVSSYEIIPNDTLTYKSSKKIYLITFSDSTNEASIYATEDDTIFSTFYQISKNFKIPRKKTEIQFFINGYKAREGSTFGSHGLKDSAYASIIYHSLKG